MNIQKTYKEILAEDNCSECHKSIGEELDVSYAYFPDGRVLCQKCINHKKSNDAKFYSRKQVHLQIINCNQFQHDTDKGRDQKQIQLENLIDVLCDIPSKELPIQVSFLSVFFNDTEYIKYLTRPKVTDFDHCAEFRDLYIYICTYTEHEFDESRGHLLFERTFLRKIRSTESLFVKKYQLDECFIDWIFDDPACHKYGLNIQDLIIRNMPQYDGIPYEKICSQFNDFSEYFQQLVLTRNENYSGLSKSMFFAFNILPTVLTQYEDDPSLKKEFEKYQIKLSRLVVEKCGQLFNNKKLGSHKQIFFYSPTSGEIDHLFKMYYKVKDLIEAM